MIAHRHSTDAIVAHEATQTISSYMCRLELRPREVIPALQPDGATLLLSEAHPLTPAFANSIPLAAAHDVSKAYRPVLAHTDIQASADERQSTEGNRKADQKTFFVQLGGAWRLVVVRRWVSESNLRTSERLGGLDGRRRVVGYEMEGQVVRGVA